MSAKSIFFSHWTLSDPFPAAAAGGRGGLSSLTRFSLGILAKMTDAANLSTFDYLPVCHFCSHAWPPTSSLVLRTMIRRPPTQLSVQESDVETLKAYRLAKMHQHNPNLTTSSFASMRQDDSHDQYSTHHLHPHHHTAQSGAEEDPGTQPGLSQQENQNPNQSNNV